MTKFTIITIAFLHVAFNISCIAQIPVIDSQSDFKHDSRNEIFRINSLNALAFISAGNNPAKAYGFAAEALELAVKVNFERGIADAELCLSVIQANLGEYDEALKNSYAALEMYSRNQLFETISEQHRNLKQKAAAFHNAGSVLCHQSNYSEALKNYSESFKIRNEIGDLKGMSDSYNGTGWVYRRKGDVIEAMKNHLKALKIQEEIADSAGMAISFQNIGIVDILQGNYSEAMRNLLKAFEIQESLKDKRGIADALGNMGWCYGEQGLYDKSLDHTVQAVKIFSEIGDKQNMALYYNNIGFLYKQKGNYDASMKNLLVAAELSDEIGDKVTLAEIYESIGEAHYSIKNYPLALLWLNKALRMAEIIPSYRIIKECYMALAKTYEKMNDYGNAYKYHRLYSDIKDIIDEESNRQIAEMKSRYETDKKDKEIQILNKDKELLKQSEALQTAEIDKQDLIKKTMLGGFSLTLILVFVLVRSFNNSKKIRFERQVSEVEMKVLRSQMNPHFIFNALFSIEDYIKHNKSDLASEYLIRFSKLMRLILENSRHKDVTLSKELQVLELYMSLESQRMEHTFSGVIEIDPEIDPEITLLPPMLLQPIVENSIWHGLAPKEAPGTIKIRFKKNKDMIQCEVEDNGVGRKHSNPVSSKIKAESYGLKILAERLAIIEHVKRVETVLEFRDLGKGDFATGLLVSFNIPYETAD